MACFEMGHAAGCLCGGPDTPGVPLGDWDPGRKPHGAPAFPDGSPGTVTSRGARICPHGRQLSICAECAPAAERDLEQRRLGTEVPQECGCVEDKATGIILRACQAHDRRTKRLKISAEFQKLADALDEAGKALAETTHQSMPGLTQQVAGGHLRRAGRIAVEIGKILS